VNFLTFAVTSGIGITEINSARFYNLCQRWLR
jgi:hypothetical protein